MTDDGDLDIEGWVSLGYWCGGDRCWRGQGSVRWCLGIGAEAIAGSDGVVAADSFGQQYGVIAVGVAVVGWKMAEDQCYIVGMVSAWGGSVRDRYGGDSDGWRFVIAVMSQGRLAI